MTKNNRRDVANGLILGRANIAKVLDRSPRTISRWYRDGRITAAKAGAAKNTLMYSRRADLVKR